MRKKKISDNGFFVLFIAVIFSLASLIILIVLLPVSLLFLWIVCSLNYTYFRLIKIQGKESDSIIESNENTRKQYQHNAENIQEKPLLKWTAFNKAYINCRSYGVGLITWFVVTIFSIYVFSSVRLRIEQFQLVVDSGNFVFVGTLCEGLIQGRFLKKSQTQNL